MSFDLPMYEQNWAMRSRLAGSSSSEDASIGGRQDDEDEILPIYWNLIEMLASQEDAGRRQRAREFLAQRLVQFDPSKSKEIRCRLLKHFQHPIRKKVEHIRLSEFFDVVLDETLEQIDLSEWSIEDQFNGDVFQKINQRSPNLQTLNLHCMDHMVTQLLLSFTVLAHLPHFFLGSQLVAVTQSLIMQNATSSQLEPFQSA